MVRSLLVAAPAIASLAAAASVIAAPSPPSSGRCAGAWNLHAPPALRATVRGAHVWQATVDNTEVSISRESWTRTNGATTRRLGTKAGCVYVFLRGSFVLSVSGIWGNGSIVRWLRAVHDSGVRGSGNACVAADG